MKQITLGTTGITVSRRTVTPVCIISAKAWSLSREISPSV